MSAFDPNSPESPSAEAAGSAPHANGTGNHPTSDGHTASANGEAATEHTTVERAEEMVDHIAASVSNFTSIWGRRIVRMMSRVKEEAEDIWGEAQSIRRGDQP